MCHSREALGGSLSLRFFLISPMPACPQTGLVSLQTYTCLGLKGCLHTGASLRSHVPISVSCSSRDLPSRRMVLHSLSHSDQGSHVCIDWPAPLLTEPWSVPIWWHHVCKGECYQGNAPHSPLPSHTEGDLVCVPLPPVPFPVAMTDWLRGEPPSQPGHRNSETVSGLVFPLAHEKAEEASL